MNSEPNSSSNRCPACDATLPDNAPLGLCPRCLRAGAMTDDVQTPSPSAEMEMAGLSKAFLQLVIQELISTGGMGRVFRAQQPHLNRTVALKVPTPERANDPEWLERFNREARA